MNITTSLVTVTPALAQEWLALHNERIEKQLYAQRSVNKMTVDRYANDMRNGHWPFNPQPIIFDTDGNLQDGQHRLWAVVKSSKSIQFQITRNSPVEAGNGLKTLDVLDRGRPRSIAQALSLSHGYTHATQLAACAVAIGSLCIDSKITRTSLPSVLAILEQQKFAKDFDIVRHRFMSYYPGSGIIGALCWYRRAHPKLADEFTNSLASLEHLGKNDPPMVLYRWLQSNKGARNEQLPIVKVTATALQAFHNDEKIQLIRSSEESYRWLTKLNPNEYQAIRQLLRGNCEKR